MSKSKEASQYVLEAITDYLGISFKNVFYVDIDTDRFFPFKKKDNSNSYELIELENNSFSGWFAWFSESELCHPEDREKIISFCNPDYLNKTFELNNSTSFSVIYRRKNHKSDISYYQSRVDFLPVFVEEKRGAVGIVRNITEDFYAYQTSLYDRSRNDKITGSPLTNHKRTILIADNNKRHIDKLYSLLHDEYEIITVSNGNKALEYLGINYIGVSAILIDTEATVCNAECFLNKVSDYPFVAQIPVIVSTSKVKIPLGEKCMELGAIDFVTRPYKAETIKNRLKSIIRLRESSVALSEIEYDDLTGVYTRQAFLHHMNVLMKNNPKKNYRLGISDISEFKTIIERYGKENANKILLYIASYFKKMSELGALVGRYGNDQFVIFAEQSELFSDEVISSTFAAACKSSPLPDITVKMGIYDNVDTSLSSQMICDRAILALDSVKRKFGESIGKYDDKLVQKINKRSIIELSMNKSLSNGDFEVYYQPKHNLSGKLVGAEALIRWNHPEYGLMSPRDFIPVFESNGFVSELDFYVFRRTCEDLKKWKKLGLNVVPVSVNCSRLDFIKKDFLEKRIFEAENNQINPELIHFEVTESHFTDYVDKVELVLGKCREYGFKIELDDFGTGYSSLNTLSSLPLDYVKIDKSLMDDVDNPIKRNVLSVSLNLSKLLKLYSVVEGVETEHQLSVLKELGCDVVQGYLYSKPLKRNDFRDYLNKYNK